jgi:hypothetical protein
MIPRTPLRNDDIEKTRDMQRPLNEAVRGISVDLRRQQRRVQSWARYTKPHPQASESGPAASIPLVLTLPDYPVACVNLLAAQDDAGEPINGTGPLGLRLTRLEVDGVPSARIEEVYGVQSALQSYMMLLEFVEDTTGGMNRSNPTSGGT